VRILQEVGKWMDRFGESVWGTSPASIPQPAWGRCTTKGGKVYLHVFEWPQDERLVVAGLERNVKKASLLGDPTGAALTCERNEAGEWVIGLSPVDLPAAALDEHDTVIVLETGE
jgi:hypothetical protein